MSLSNDRSSMKKKSINEASEDTEVMNSDLVKPFAVSFKEHLSVLEAFSPCQPVSPEKKVLYVGIRFIHSPTK